MVEECPILQTKKYTYNMEDKFLNNSLYPTSRNNANLEAEKGETVLTDIEGIGIPQFFKIQGKSHKDGGTPLNLPENSFIYSKYNRMKIKDPEILKDLGFKPKKSGYTPAELSKRFDLTKDNEILYNPNSSDLERRTAEYNIKNKINKLGEIALAQESIKGFEDGIPLVAMPYLENNGIDPMQFLPQQQGMDYGLGEVQDEYPVKRLGGQNLPKYQEAGEVTESTPTVDRLGFEKEEYNLLPEYYNKEFQNFFNFFLNNQDEADILLNKWKNMKFKVNQGAEEYNLPNSVKGDDYTSDDFLEQYARWIYYKTLFKLTNEYKETNPDNTSEGSERTNVNRGTNVKNNGTVAFIKYLSTKDDAFKQKEGESEDKWINRIQKRIKFFQSMDQAVEQYKQTRAQEDSFKEKGYTMSSRGFNNVDGKNNAIAMKANGEKDDNGIVSTIDGLAGSYTLDYYPFITPPKEEEQKADAENTNGLITPKHIDRIVKSPAAGDIYWQDENNLRGALRDYAEVRKYMPWESPINYEDAMPTFYDYRNDASRMASNAASIQLASGLSADPNQNAVLAASLMNGLGEQTMQLQANENNYNVKTANDFELANAQRRDVYNKAEAARENELYDKMVTVNQNFTNARRALRKNVRDTYNNAITNAAKTQILNTMYDNYNINPRMGGTMDFYYDPEDLLTPQAKQDKQNAVLKYAKDIQTQFPNITPKEALDAAQRIVLKTDSEKKNVLDQVKGIYDQLAMSQGI